MKNNATYLKGGYTQKLFNPDSVVSQQTNQEFYSFTVSPLIKSASAKYVRGPYPPGKPVLAKSSGVAPINYHKYIIDRTTSFTGSTTSFSSDGRIKRTTDGCDGNLSGWDNPVPDSLCRTLAYNQALSRLNSQVRGDLDLSIALAEAGQTRRMFNLVEAAKVMAARKYKAITIAGSTFLQFQYGWQPLLSDIFGTAEEMRRTAVNQLTSVKARGKATRSYTGKYDTYVHGVMAYKVPFWHYYEQKCELGITYTPPTFDIARWGSLNPVSLAWELIPYSFVVDWFYDVGSYMRDVETKILYETRFNSGYKSELSINRQSYQGSGPASGGVASYSTYEGHCLRNTVQFERTVLSSYPAPQPPRFKIDLGWQRQASAASLLSQFLGQEQPDRNYLKNSPAERLAKRYMRS